MSTVGTMIWRKLPGTVLGVTNSPYVQLKAQRVTSGLQYEWTSPQGFKSKQQNPFVFAPGVYTVIGTDPSNGCQCFATIEVMME